MFSKYILPEERKRKRHSGRWKDEIDDEEDAKIRETWARERLETFQNDVFPNGFPTEIDANTVFCELVRSKYNDPYTHIITLLWRENEDDIRAFGRAISRNKSWLDVVQGSAPLPIPAIGGREEIMALAVLYHGCKMSDWLSRLWESMQLDWVTHPNSPKPEFWAGVKLSRGSKYQAKWPQGHARRLHCDISKLLDPIPANENSSNVPAEATKAYKKHKVTGRKEKPRKSKSVEFDSDDEPLVRPGKLQPKPKSENNLGAILCLLQEMNRKRDQERKNDMVWKQEMELKVDKLVEDVKRNGRESEEVREDHAGQIHDLHASLHSTLGKVEVMGDGLKNLHQSINKALAQRHAPLDKIIQPSTRQELSYNTPTKTPAKGKANLADTGTRTGGWDYRHRMIRLCLGKSLPAWTTQRQRLARVRL
ncbi:hypothetical protein B0T18DRAFT_395010 [Schizothecium vesticola]|uniref:Uncharacterized protein n=1 Tax=Schizothecium vesticola TaxID=314040 RepID=A0AA40BR07_9PEZI|nr:hypothetical protein B0T18DRAFT_395010 [Schizothecium vesticola]